MKAIQDTISKGLYGFGGYLKCFACGKTQPIGDIGNKIAHGWPKCCGYTMTWITNSLKPKEE